MKTNAFTASVILEKRREGKAGFPIKLRITYLRKSYYFTVRDNTGNGIWMKEEEYKKLTGKRTPSDLIQLKHDLNDFEKKAYEVAEHIFTQTGSFSVDRFKELFFSKDTPDATPNLIQALSKKVSEMKDEGRISTAIGYQCVINSMKDFAKSDFIPFTRCTPDFFRKYEKWFLADGKSITTVGIYLRNIRTVFNDNIRSKNIPAELYPFGRGKYEIPTGKNIKKALKLEDIKKIMDFEFSTKSKNYYKNLWLFSYFCNGINIKDIAMLKYSDIEGDVIVYSRAKTTRSNRTSPRKINIVINRHVGKIIDTYGTKSGDYIFNIIRKDMDDVKKYQAVQQMV